MISKHEGTVKCYLLQFWQMMNLSELFCSEGVKHAGSHLGSGSMAQGLSDDGQGEGSSGSRTVACNDVAIDSDRSLGPTNTLDCIFKARIAYCLAIHEDA